MSTALGFDSERLKRIDAWMTANRERGRYTGSSLLLARHGEIAYLGFDGLRSVDKNLPYERDTILRIYSMTKPVTSVVFAMLLERGEVYLDTPVSEYIPAFSNMRSTGSPLS